MLVILCGCKKNALDVDISDIDAELVTHRFDKDLFMLDLDTIDKAISTFYSRYGAFFDVYNVHVINIGPASDRHYDSYLSMFINNPQNVEVYDFAQQVYDDTETLENSLQDAFRRYLYHYPDSAIPEIIFFIGGFNHRLFTVNQYVGVGIDQYLGTECRFYSMMGTAEYMIRNKIPEKIPSDVANVWGSSLYGYNDAKDNVLSRMIYGGQLMYFTEALLPEEADSLKIGFTASQLSFCKKNEKQMWTYLIENELLFSTDQLVIKRLVEDAPTTYYFPDESPGKAAVWLGWQIVREYAKKHPDLSLDEIMQENDYQKILRESKYTP